MLKNWNSKYYENITSRPEQWRVLYCPFKETLKFRVEIRLQELDLKAGGIRQKHRINGKKICLVKSPLTLKGCNNLK
jgi:hypothetical protein